MMMNLRGEAMDLRWRPRGMVRNVMEEMRESERKCDEEREWNVKKLMSQMKLGFIKWKWSLVNDVG